MKISRKGVMALAAVLAGATSLVGSAADPYYDGYTYDRYGYRYDRFGNMDPYYRGSPAVGPRLDYSYRDNRDYRDYRRRELRRDWRDLDGDGVRDVRPEPYYNPDLVDGQGNPRGHGGPGGAPAKDGGSPG